MTLGVTPKIGDKGVALKVDEKAAASHLTLCTPLSNRFEWKSLFGFAVRLNRLVNYLSQNRFALLEV